MSKRRRPTNKEVRSWIKKEYGNVYWRGAEIPIWIPETIPRPIPMRSPFSTPPGFESNHFKRCDLMFELKGVIFLCETDPVPFHSSIGQLICYRFWLPKCFPRWFKGKRIRLYLFCRENDLMIAKAARHAGIRVIII